MSDTPRNLPPVIDPIMVSTLLGKRDALLAERSRLRAERTRLAQRDREIDRDLADLQAAGRVFGFAVDLPKDDAEADDLFRTWQSQVRNFRNVFTKEELANAGTPAAKAVATKSEMPRIGDVVLDRLRAAGKEGSKAAPIQTYIESTYGKKIHDKTVGMTLYRLQREGRVHRRAHTWFIAPEAVNPGAVTPGPETSQK
jgi:hypothetical protein